MYRVSVMMSAIKRRKKNISDDFIFFQLRDVLAVQTYTQLKCAESYAKLYVIIFYTFPT